MTEIESVIVRLSQDEAARGGVFWERNPQHALVDPRNEGGEVFISGRDPAIVANTWAVVDAIKRGRLDVIQAAQPQELDPADIPATDAARELAAEHGIDLAELTGSGHDGIIVTADVQREIRRRLDGKARP